MKTANVSFIDSDKFLFSDLSGRSVIAWVLSRGLSWCTAVRGWAGRGPSSLCTNSLRSIRTGTTTIVPTIHKALLNLFSANPLSPQYVQEEEAVVSVQHSAWNEGTENEDGAEVPAVYLHLQVSQRWNQKWRGRLLWNISHWDYQILGCSKWIHFRVLHYILLSALW